MNQEEGKPAQKMVPGDVVIVNPNPKHWHGTTKDSWFAHVAVMIGEGCFLFFSNRNYSNYNYRKYDYCNLNY